MWIFLCVLACVLQEGRESWLGVCEKIKDIHDVSRKDSYVQAREKLTMHARCSGDGRL